MTENAGKRERTIEVLRRGSRALPALRAWTADLLAQHAHAARPIAERGFSRLAEYFPPAVLNETLLVSVQRVPFPPLSTQFDLPELVELEHMSFSAITFAGVIFAHASVTAESTYFHEL